MIEFFFRIFVDALRQPTWLEDALINGFKEVASLNSQIWAKCTNSDLFVPLSKTTERKGLYFKLCYELQDCS